MTLQALRRAEAAGSLRGMPGDHRPSNLTIPLQTGSNRVEPNSHRFIHGEPPSGRCEKGGSRPGPPALPRDLVPGVVGPNRVAGDPKPPRTDRRLGGPRDLLSPPNSPKDGREVTNPAETALCQHCGRPFSRTNMRKLHCSEAHQRAAANARYRARKTEQAICPNCETVFTRSATSTRSKVYCSVHCQQLSRSATYKVRPDIQAGIQRARETRDGAEGAAERTARVADGARQAELRNTYTGRSGVPSPKEGQCPPSS